jgi:hypothetical protein
MPTVGFPTPARTQNAAGRGVNMMAKSIFKTSAALGTGSVSCNSILVLHLCHFLNQEDLMEREAMVQNP